MRDKPLPADESIAKVGAGEGLGEVVVAPKHRAVRFARSVCHWPPGYWLVAAAFGLLAALLRWEVAPNFEQLPADYSAQARYAAWTLTHPRPTSPAQEYNSVVVHREQTLISEAGHSIIQAGMHWLTPAGNLIHETRNIFGVDRRSRKNVDGYGNQNRMGQYLFPRHTEKKSYILWDAYYAGPGGVTFDHVENFQGLELYVFNFQCDLDETAAYEMLPDVPRKYHVSTVGDGRYWVEPTSGVVVKHEDHGASYFTEPGTARRVGEAVLWRAHYAPETIEAKVQDATVTRRWMLALEMWLPLALTAAGLIWIGIGLRTLSERAE